MKSLHFSAMRLADTLTLTSLNLIFSQFLEKTVLAKIFKSNAPLPLRLSLGSVIIITGMFLCYICRIRKWSLRKSAWM
jgi:hypothetical protein